MQQKKILIVDDDQHIVRLLEVLLQEEGFGVLSANDGSYGLEKVILEKPDLILLDIDMPQMNGFEVLERLKENPATKKIPVIMLTANSESSAVQRAIDNKVDRYIAKPFRGKFLLEKIKDLIEE